MGNPLEDFLGNSDQINVTGWFPCQHCDEDVEGAFYDKAKDTLSWKCLDCKKTTTVEEFTLG